MKLIKFTTLSAIIFGFTFLTSCNGASSKASTAKENEAKFLESCISSAKKNYEKAGLKPDEELITKRCKCFGKELDLKYGFDNLPETSQEKIKEILVEATQKCIELP
ncbi:hypothetical protein [uncultured Tenacibaculum sp.]|uniref:hypothetical protein n=1 Tax=uncultured Tenacibaculum sp. TaxID=174713 RepID=UPI0026142613|nr:hypothetical protein [uncultured Tenacibaculum sp.]